MYNMIAQNGETVYGVSEFVADTKEDLAKLPRSCAMGSSCLVLQGETGPEVYVKNSQGEWVIL